MARANLAKPRPWMNTREAGMFNRLVADLQRIAAKRAVARSPLLDLRIDDLAITLLLARRAEARLEVQNGGATEAKTGTGAIETIGKIRERLRKTITEFEDYIERVGRPMPTNIVEAMAPIMLQIGDTLDQFWVDDDPPGAPPEDTGSVPPDDWQPRAEGA